MNPYTEIRLPDGMTRAEAERILAEHIAWVPWPRERGSFPEGARIRSEWVYLGSSVRVDYIHPDDVPTDPDADLIEKIARDIYRREWGPAAAEWSARPQSARDIWLRKAREIVTAVRDHEAQR